MPDPNELRTAAGNLADGIVRICDELDRLRERTAVSVTVGGGLEVFGSMDAVERVQAYILATSEHPVEKDDTNRSLLRQLMAIETANATLEEQVKELEHQLAIRPPAPKPYSPDWVREQAKHAYFLDHHRCSICDVMVGYEIEDYSVRFRSNCDCTTERNTRHSSFNEIAQWLALQHTDEARDNIMKGLHFRTEANHG